MRRLLTNCSVVPCDGRPAIEDAEILIDGNRIEVITSALLAHPRDARDDHERFAPDAIQPVLEGLAVAPTIC
jgi:hypothetical protein